MKFVFLLFLSFFLFTLFSSGQKKETLPKVKVLDSVTVTPDYIPMYMRKDTLEYHTANVRLKARATVEDLLRQLPGFRIDEHGVITVNGEKIEKLLVDGEDIFSRDPTLVTRTLDASAIAKVQVLNKISSKAAFTGIRDGKTTRTINLELKEDRKNDSFVKTEAGAGLQPSDNNWGNSSGNNSCNNCYDVKAIAADFKGKRQLTAFGSLSNTGSTGFNGELDDGDLQGFDVPGVGNGGLDASAGAGIPRLIGGAMHYADTRGRNHAAGNYQYGQSITHPFSSFITQQTLPGKLYRQEGASHSDNNQDRHDLFVGFNLAPDSSNAFGIWVGGKTRTGDNQYTNSGNGYFNDTLANSSLRNIRSQVKNQDFKGHLGWRRTGRTRKRIFSLLTDFDLQDNRANGFLYAVNNFYPAGNGQSSRDTVDQRKAVSGKTMMASTSLNYSEPLWKDARLTLSYELGFNRSQSNLDTYNKEDGKYQARIDSLSNQLEYHIITHKGSLGIQSYTNKTVNYWAGAEILDYAYRQTDLMQHHFFRYSSLSLIPKAGLLYYTRNKTVTFSYIGRILQPTVMQLQPVLNNIDPLHIVQGNPGLQPGISHDFSIIVASPKSVITNLALNYGVTTHEISERTITDSLGRQISEAVNTKGSTNAKFRIAGYKNWEPLKVDVDFNTHLAYNCSFNFVNDVLNRNENYQLGGDIGVRKYIADKFTFSLIAGAAYFYSRSSVNSAAITRYWVQNHAVQFTIFPIAGLEMATSSHFSWRQKTTLFDRPNQTLVWNVYLQKTLMHNRLSIRCQVNDLLGQNAGITRTIAANLVSENHYNVLGRYWLLTAIYRFLVRSGQEKSTLTLQ